MTIRTFQELHYIHSNTQDEVDKSILMVGAITGLTAEKVDNMPMGKFKRLCAKINKQFAVLGKKLEGGKPRRFVVIGWKIFRINYTDINAGKYVEAMEFNKDIIPNLHKIMATLCTRVKFKGFKLVPVDMEHKDKADILERANFEAAYHAAVFFYLQYTVSMRVIQPYLVKQAVRKGANKEQTETALTNLQTVLDGYTTPKWYQSLREYLWLRFGS